MTTKPLIAIFLLVLSCSPCLGQSEYTIPLAKEKPSLSVPSLARRGRILYVAYRTYNWLRNSSWLHVAAYDLDSHKEVRQATIAVSEVHGQRAAQGLFISPDGKTLAYSEAYDPEILLLLSATDLSEIRRSMTLPFTADDYDRRFAGFTEDGLLAFASVGGDGRMRFLHIYPGNLSRVSVTRMTGPQILGPANRDLVWLASKRLAWINEISPTLPVTYKWTQYTESGDQTGEGMVLSDLGLCRTATPVGRAGLLVFFGNNIGKGSVVRYSDHHTSELKLKCVPEPYGISDDPRYAGAMCVTMTDRSEPANNITLTSEFFLLQTGPPEILWRHRMRWLDIPSSKGVRAGYQIANPLIFTRGRQVWIVAPSRKPELNVFTVTPQE